jgi:hypothetical protein
MSMKTGEIGIEEKCDSRKREERGNSSNYPLMLLFLVSYGRLYAYRRVPDTITRCPLTLTANRKRPECFASAPESFRSIRSGWWVSLKFLPQTQGAGAIWAHGVASRLADLGSTHFATDLKFW